MSPIHYFTLFAIGILPSLGFGQPSGDLNFSEPSSAWKALFDGDHLPAKHYLGKPNASIDLPGYERDEQGNYTESLGSDDPLNVFSIKTIENEPAIRISGQVIGGLVLSDSISNFHLKLKFKWGDSSWGWMEGQPKGGGVLYQGANGGRHELQMHEGEIGSYWSRNVVLDVPAEYTMEIPKPVIQLRPFLKDYVSTLTDTMLVFNPKAGLHHFDGDHDSKAWQIVIANPYNEFSTGWNTVEIICYKNHVLHKLNGETNMILLNTHVRKQNGLIPMDYGSIILQSGGSEVFFKEIYYRSIHEVPKEMKEYIR